MALPQRYEWKESTFARYATTSRRRINQKSRPGKESKAINFRQQNDRKDYQKSEKNARRRNGRMLTWRVNWVESIKPALIIRNIVSHLLLVIS